MRTRLHAGMPIALLGSPVSAAAGFGVRCQCRRSYRLPTGPHELHPVVQAPGSLGFLGLPVDMPKLKLGRDSRHCVHSNR